MSAAAMICPTSTPPRISTPPAIPVIEGFDPPEGWGWCYVDKVMFDLSKRKTPHNGTYPALLLSQFARAMRALLFKACAG